VADWICRWRPSPPDEAIAHFGFVGGLLALDMPALNDRTREMLGWHPGHPGLVEDLEQATWWQPTA
jgi:hypothetical protein